MHLPRPVCLVAHFGLGFDFPLLRAELEKIGFDFGSNSDEIGLSLADDLLVVDSLEAFRQIFAEKAKEEAVTFFKFAEARGRTWDLFGFRLFSISIAAP